MNQADTSSTTRAEHAEWCNVNDCDDAHGIECDCGADRQAQ